MCPRIRIDSHWIGSDAPAIARGIALGRWSHAGRVHIRGPLRLVSGDWSRGGGGRGEEGRLAAETDAGCVGPSRAADLGLLLLELSFEVFLIVIHFGRRKIKILRGFPFGDV